MEHNPSSTLFGLAIDPITKAHLAETARWARFLSILGFVFLGLMVFGGVLLSLFTNRPMDNYGGSGVFDAYSVSMAFFSIFISVIWFFPLLFLYRFASRMNVALKGNDQNELNLSFQNLKASFRFVGIVSIIGLALYALLIVFAIVGATAFS